MKELQERIDNVLSNLEEEEHPKNILEIEAFVYSMLFGTSFTEDNYDDIHDCVYAALLKEMKE